MPTTYDLTNPTVKEDGWTFGLCGCFGNCFICITTYLVPCYSVGRLAEDLGNSCCLYCVGSMIPIVNLIIRISQRGKVRNLRKISGGCFGDFLCVFFCPFCTLTQERQEMQLISESEIRRE